MRHPVVSDIAKPNLPLRLSFNPADELCLSHERISGSDSVFIPNFHPNALRYATRPLHVRADSSQPVYLCQTCPEAKGVCASCSIACHADHEQIEL